MKTHTFSVVHRNPTIMEERDHEGNFVGFRSDDERVVKILEENQGVTLEELVKSMKE